MGEKPLSTDEAPAQMATIGGAGPLGGVDIPPPGMAAAGIITTRSNIKHSGGIRSEPTRPGDPFPTETGPGQPGGVGGTYGPDAEDGALAIKENGIKYGGDAAEGATSEAGGAAGVAGEPIPGIDTNVAGAVIGPVKPVPTRPTDPVPADAGPAGMAIKEQGVRYGEEAAGPDDPPADSGVDAANRSAGEGGGGAAAPSEADAPGVAGGVGEPIPGIDVIVKKRP